MNNASTSTDLQIECMRLNESNKEQSQAGIHLYHFEAS